MSTLLSLPTPTAVNPAAASLAREHAVDDLFSLPDWLYRSEAFAEDLPGVVAPQAAKVTPEKARRGLRLPGALYLATLALAVVASVPGTLIA